MENKTVTHDIFKNPDQLLSYYNIQAADFRMRHTAIWTEVQHYTWVLSVVLGAGPLSAVSQKSLTPVQLGFLLFLPLVGIVVSILAFYIIRRDFVYYSQADSRLLYIEKQLGVVKNKGYADERLHRAEKPDFSVIQDVKKQTVIGVRSVIKGRIRALILTTFIVYTLAGIGEVSYFAYLLFHR